MVDAETLSDMLEALSTHDAANRTRRQISTLRGIRGVPYGEIARTTAAAWHDMGVDLKEDEGELDRLFATSFEDGLVAIGLLAAALPDAPQDALEIGLDWASRVDDLATADALGWLILGPGSIATQRPLTDLPRAGHDALGRAAIMSAMALTTESVEGPAAAALRERRGSRQVAISTEADSDQLAAVASAFVKDPRPPVRKGLRRVLRAWSGSDPASVAAWGQSLSDLPKLLRPEIKRAERRAS